MQKKIFMIHGLWGGGWIWSNFKEHFSLLGYECFNPSLPYHEYKFNTQPPKVLGKLSLFDYIEFLKSEIEKLDEKPIIFGHSMGGLFAQILANQGYAEALVLFNPVPPSDINSFSLSSLKCMKKVFIKSLLGLPHLIGYKSMQYSAFNNIDKNRHIEYYSKLVYGSGRAFIEMAIPYFAKNMITTIETNSNQCPVLVIGSKKDHTIPVKITQQIAKKYPCSEYLEYPDNAHWIIIENNWKTVAEDVGNWINKL